MMGRRKVAAPPQFGPIGSTLPPSLAAFALAAMLLVLISSSLSSSALAPLSAVVSPCTSAAPLLSVDRFAFGCLESSPDSFFLAVFFRSAADPLPVWTANPTRPVSRTASLLFSTVSFRLDLSDPGIFPAWSLPFSTASASPVSIALEDSGNLRILDSMNSPLWQSFLHPLDLLLPGQVMSPGMKLTAGSQPKPAINTVEIVTYTALMESAAFVLFVDSVDSRSLPYSIFSLDADSGHSDDAFNSRVFCNGSVDSNGPYSTELQLSYDATQLWLRSCVANVSMNRSITFAAANHQTVDFLRLDPDGNMRGYKYNYTNATWGVVYDWFAKNSSISSYGTCNLPNVCGPYGICNPALAESTCSCPHLSGTHKHLLLPLNKSDLRQGCRLAHPLNCSAGEGSYYFIELQAADYFANDALSNEQISRSTEHECIASCARNCTCKLAFYRADTGACLQYEQVLSIIGVGNATTLVDPSRIVAGNKVKKAAYVTQLVGRSAPVAPQLAQLAAAQSTTNSTNDVVSKYVGFLKVMKSSGHGTPSVAGPVSTKASKKGYLIITLGSGGASLFFLLVTIGLLCVCCKRRWRRFKALRDEEFYTSTSPGQHTMVHFTFAQLQEASGDFKFKLGVGGFGSVYKGTLPDGSMVAIKQLENAVRADQEFESEAVFLHSLNHPNLVRLIGFCSNGLRRLLISDYMLHGSLDAWLFQRPVKDNAPFSSSSTRPSSLLDWRTRFGIALDVAKGLAFLHEKNLVHLAIKPQNILLDERFVAKLSDYGLSRLMDKEEGCLIMHMRGATGYMAPEWLQHACATEKSDVYSYGMVLMEMLGGRKNVDLSKERESWFFPLLAAKMYKEGRVQEVLDENLIKNNMGAMGEAEREQAKMVMQIAFWCIIEAPAQRPDMTSIVSMLQGHEEVPKPPLPISFSGRIAHSPTMSNIDENHRLHHDYYDHSGASSPSCFNISLASEPSFAVALHTSKIWCSGGGHSDDCSLLLPSQN